jgi:hypothetical protein
MCDRGSPSGGRCLIGPGRVVSAGFRDCNCRPIRVYVHGVNVVGPLEKISIYGQLFRPFSRSFPQDPGQHGGAADGLAATGIVRGDGSDQSYLRMCLIPAASRAA